MTSKRQFNDDSAVKTTFIKINARNVLTGLQGFKQPNKRAHRPQSETFDFFGLERL